MGKRLKANRLSHLAYGQTFPSDTPESERDTMNATDLRDAMHKAGKVLAKAQETVDDNPTSMKANCALSDAEGVWEGLRADYWAALQELREDLFDASETLESATKARDNWEPDSDDRTHVERYDDMLDECHGEFLGMQASRILKECDPTAYRCGFNDWTDSIEGDRERRQTFSDYDDLCDEVEEAESARDDAQEALDTAREAREAGEG